MLARNLLNDFTLTDWTEEVNTIPNLYGTIANLNIFQDVPLSATTGSFDEVIYSGGLLVDKIRGERGSKAKGTVRKTHTFTVPHFPFDDYIEPKEIANKRAFGSANEAEQLAYVRARKLEKIRRTHAALKEYSRAYTISTGAIYAPSGTVDVNWNTEFGWTRLPVDMLLGSPTTEVIQKIEVGIASLKANANGEQHTGYVMLASPELFNKIIFHGSVKVAYSNYASLEEPYRQRLGGPLATARMFPIGGANIIEVVDTAPDGTRHIPVGKGYLLPTGTNVFKTFYAPVERFGYVNTLAEQSYVFEFANQNLTSIVLESESNLANALLNPSQVVEFSSSN